MYAHSLTISDGLIFYILKAVVEEDEWKSVCGLVHCRNEDSERQKGASKKIKKKKRDSKEEGMGIYRHINKAR